MESSEGRGIARGRFESWWWGLPEDFRHAFGGYDGKPAHRAADTVPSAGWTELATSLREESELVGFWLAWHCAGGFEALERAGWNRATIYRKSRRFRAVFGAHPDEHTFSWLTVNFDRVWMEELGFTFDESTNSWRG